MLRSLYVGWSALLFLLILIQVGFAGYGAFAVADDVDEGVTVDEDRFDDLFGLHAGFGYVVILAGLIFLVIGIAAGIGRWRLGRHGLLALLLVLQMFLAWFGMDVPWVFGFLHTINALFVFTLSGWIAWSEWKHSRTLGRAAPA